MKLVALSDTGSFSCQTDQTTLSAAVSHKAPWLPDKGVVFVLVDDEGRVVEPQATEEMQHRVTRALLTGTLNWPVPVMTAWLNQKWRRFEVGW